MKSKAKSATPAVKKKPVIKTVKQDGKTVKINITSLEAKYDKGCAHNSYNYYYNNGGGSKKGPKVCEVVGTEYLKALDAGIDVGAKYLDKYLGFIFNGTKLSYWSRRYKCGGQKLPKLAAIVSRVLEHHKPKPQMLKRIASQEPDGYYIKSLRGLTKNQSFTKFDTDFILHCFNKHYLNCNSPSCAHVFDIKFLLANTVIDQQIFDLLLQCRCQCINNIILDMLGGVYDGTFDDDFELDPIDAMKAEDGEEEGGEEEGGEGEDEKGDNDESTESGSHSCRSCSDNSDDGSSCDHESHDSNKLDSDELNSDELTSDESDGSDNDDDGEETNALPNDIKSVETVGAQPAATPTEPFDVSKLLSYESLYSTCYLLPKSAPIFECIVKKGFPVDSKCLEIVCGYGDEEAIKFILDYKIPVERVHFRNVIESYKYATSKSRWAQNIGAYKPKGFTMNKAELLFRSGYRMDYDDIIFTIDKKVFIDDIERFGVPLDNKIYEYCHNNHFYPEYKFELVDRLQMELQKLCNAGNLAKIKKYVEANKLKPGQKCLHLATQISRNYDVIAYLIEAGCYMDKEATMNFIKVNTYGWRRDKELIPQITENISKHITSVEPKDEPKVEAQTEQANDTISVSLPSQPTTKSSSSGLIEVDGINDDDADEILETKPAETKVKRTRKTAKVGARRLVRRSRARRAV